MTWNYYLQTADVGTPDPMGRSRAYHQDLELRLDPTVNPRSLSLYRIDWRVTPPTRTLIDTATYSDSYNATGLLSLGNGKFLSLSASGGNTIGWVIDTAGGALAVGPQLSIHTSAAGYNLVHPCLIDTNTVACTTDTPNQRWFTTTFTDTAATQVADLSLVTAPVRSHWAHTVAAGGRVVLDNYISSNGSDFHLQLRNTNGALLQDVDLAPTTTSNRPVNVTSGQGHDNAHGGQDALGRAVLPVNVTNFPTNTTAAAEARIYDVTASTLNQVGTLTVATAAGAGVAIDFRRLIRMGTTGSRFVCSTSNAVNALVVIDTEAMTVEQMPIPPSEVGHQIYEVMSIDEDSFWVEFSGGEYLYRGVSVPVSVLMQGELLTMAGEEVAALRSVSPFAIDPELTNGPPTIAGADPGGVVVGTNPLLDGSDATYARTAITQGSGQVSWICVPLKSIPDLTPANFSRLTVYVRVKGTASGGATYPLRFLVSFMTLDFRFISEFVDPAPISASFQVADSTTVDAVLNHTMLQGNSGTYADGVSDLIPKLVSGDCQLVFYVLTNFGNPNGSRYVGDLFELSVTTAHGVAEPVSVLMQGETLTWAEGASPGTLAVTSMLSAGTSLTEDFEGGTAGAVITTANTIFEGVNGLDPVFTNEVAHSGTLSAKTSLAISVLDVPYGYEKVSDTTQASGSFWFRWTGDTGTEERGIFSLFTTAALGDLIMNEGIMAVEFVTNGDGDGWHFRYNHDGGTTVDVPVTMSSYVNTWLQATWSFDAGVLDFVIETAAGASVFTLADTTVDGTAFGRSKYYLGDGGGFRNYLDDVVLTVSAAVEEPVSVLMQGSLLTTTGGS
jgi:hypothetical protein